MDSLVCLRDWESILRMVLSGLSLEEVVEYNCGKESSAVKSFSFRKENNIATYRLACVLVLIPFVIL